MAFGMEKVNYILLVMATKNMDTIQNKDCYIDIIHTTLNVQKYSTIINSYRMLVGDSIQCLNILIIRETP